MAKTRTSFTKGQSGNPAGRPPIVAELRARALKAVDEHVLQAWIDEVIEHGPHWVRCSELLASYGIGKPPQVVEPEADKQTASGCMTLRFIDP